MNQPKIIFIDGDINEIEKVITKLEIYLAKKVWDYSIMDFPIVFNQYGCLAIHEKVLINQFVLSYLSFRNQYFESDYLYILKTSFYKFFLTNPQLIYTYLTLKDDLPDYSVIIIDDDIDKYKKLNNLLNYQTLYSKSSQDETNNLLNILGFLRL